MGVTTYNGRARRALLHKTDSVYWVGVGRTTAWENEEAPPSPSPGQTATEEPVVYVKPQAVNLCKVVNESEDVTVLGTKYAYVADENAITENARFLYIRAKLDPTEGQPYDTFRQVVVLSNLTPATGYEEAQWLDPANVSDEGLLEYVDNDTAVTMGLTRQEVIEIIIEFR